MLGRRLQETAQRETDRVQRLMAEIQQEARQGNSENLAHFIEKRVKEVFELAAVQVTFHKEDEMGEDPGAFPNKQGLGSRRLGSPFRKGRSRKSFRPRAILWE